MGKMSKMVLTALAGMMTAVAVAADLPLPPPAKEGGKPLMEALSARKTSRAFADRELEAPVLSSLLWAANGINRPDGRHTAPTGLNVQDVDIYVMLKSGVYRYDAKANSLVEVAAGDFRTAAGRQEFAQKAAVNLFYVHDTARAMKTDEASGWRYAGIHAGAIMQNVYLYCASGGMSTVARGALDYDALAKVLKLAPTQRVILGQTVGYPAESAEPVVIKSVKIRK